MKAEQMGTLPGYMRRTGRPEIRSFLCLNAQKWPAPALQILFAKEASLDIVLGGED